MVARQKRTKAEGTFLKYENAINGFLASLGPRAKLNVNQIAPRDVLRFRDAQTLDGKSPSTANDRVKIIRMAFTTARKARIRRAQPGRCSRNAAGEH
jgi:hypothetical protein